MKYEANDFVLTGSSWITVNNISISIKYSSKGVTVELSPRGQEPNVMAETWLTFQKAQDEIDKSGMR